jgi:hypothetical protein
LVRHDLKFTSGRLACNPTLATMGGCR